jgi:hypothetical protein
MGSSCGIPFFPRVLVHLVRFDRLIVQGIAVQADAGALLKPVSEGQQFLAIAAQLACHLRRGGALSDAVQDHQEL